MATPEVDLGVNLNAADLERALTAAVTNAMAKASKEISSGIKKAFEGLGTSAKKSIGDTLRSVDRESKAAQEGIRRLDQRFDALAKSSAAAAKAFGDGFDPEALASVEDALREVVKLQGKLADGADNLPDSDYKRLVDQTGLLESNLRAVRDIAVKAGRAADEANRNVSRSDRQRSRESIEASRSASSRFVVEQQRQASAARDASREAVEATRASSRQRVAIVQGAARTIATIERGLSNAFRGTAAAIGGAFRGLGSTVEGVAAGLRRSVTNTTTQISNDYSQSFRQSTRTVQNETRQQASVINNFAREAKQSISSISAVGTGAAVGLGAVIGGVLGVGAARALQGGFQRATILENSERALTKLLGTAEEAKALLTDVTEIVTGTPFRLDQFASAATQLLAFNVEAEKIPEVLRTIGDAAALSIDPDLTVDRLVRTFGQIQAAGKLATEDINQLTEAGVPAWALLGNQLGKTTLEMRDLVTEGAVPATQAIDLLLNGIQNGTDGVNGATVAFAGLSKELGTTLKGSLANFNTSISRLGANIITAFREPFTAALGAATAAVDLLGSALKILAVEIQQSPTFQLTQRGLSALTVTLKEARVTLAPVFSFLSGGLVLLGQAALGLLALKSIPGVLRALGSAIKFVLAPQRLLVAGLILAASYFKQLYDESQDLRVAFGELFGTLSRIATVVKDLVVDAFKALTGGAEEASGEVAGFGSAILDVVIPAVEKLSTFLLEKVLPPIRNFAKFIRTEVLPVLGTALGTAIEFAKDAFESFVEFVRTEVVPVVGTILAKAVEIGTAAFTRVYDFLSKTFVPFIQNNLTPVLAGLGVALGTLALTGGNLPLAGLAGLTAGIVAVLSNEDIRNALVENIGEAVDAAKEKLGELFSGDTLQKIGVGALKAARKIGEVLGNVFTDPRLLAGLAGVAAAAAALAGSFALGLVQGVASNLPEIVDGLVSLLGEAFSLAFEALTSDPRIIAAVAGALLGAAAIARLVVDARKTGRVLAAAISEGAVSAGNLGVGGGARGFVSGLLGGPAAIQAAAAKAGTEYAATMAKAINKDNALIRAVTGQGLTLDQARGAGGRFTGGAAGSPANLAKTTEGLKQLETAYGRAAVAGARFQLGLQNIFGPSTQRNVLQGLSQIGTAVRTSGREIASAAGVIAGGAFAASFVAQALFDVNSSGKDKLQAALGTVAIGAATGAQFGPKGAAIGAGVGVAASAIGFLSTVLRGNEADAKAAAAALDGYADALEGIAEGGSTLDTIRSKFRSNLREVEGVADALSDAGFSFRQFEEVLTNQRTGGAFIADVRGQLKAAGVEAGAAEAAVEFLKVQLGGVNDALRADNQIDSIFTQAKTGAEGASQAADIAEQATAFWRDRVVELNDARIDGFKARVDEAKGLLDEAGSAADSAREKFASFLSGETAETGLNEQINNAIIGVGNLASGVSGLDFTLVKDQAAFDNDLLALQQQISGVLAEATPAPGDVEGVLAPFRTAIEQEDLTPEVAAKFQAAIDGAAAAYVSPEGQTLLGGLFKAEDAEAAAATALEAARSSLATAIETDPLKIPLLLETATEDTEAFVNDIISGLEIGLSDIASVQAASKALGDAVWEELEASLETGSPSKKTEEIGGYAVDGLVKGLEVAGPARGAAFRLGVSAYQGLIAGVQSGTGFVAIAGRNLARTFENAIRAELVIESPSKVTAELGEQAVEGFVVGIDDSLPLIDRIAFSAATRISSTFQNIGARAGQAIGLGFAQEGIGFASSVAGALSDALDEAASKVDQFKVIGNQIARALFSGQGTGAGGFSDRSGGSLEAQLQLAYLKVLDSTRGFGDKLRQSVETATAFFGGNADAGRSFGASVDFGVQGEQNRAAFLEAGLNIREYIDTVLASGRSLEEVADAARFQRDQLVGTAAAFGLTGTSLNELVRQLGLTNEQIDQFVASTREAERAAAAAGDEAERALAAQKAAEAAQKAWEEASAAAEKAAQAAAERQREEEERERREFTFRQPVFRDLIVQSPSGDPEAVALAAANRVAFSIRR